VRHEETAAFAAGAEAHLTGQLAVRAGSCGPGNLHLINGLDCHRTVMAIAAHIPTGEIDSGYFQETDPRQVLAECSHYIGLVATVSQIGGHSKWFWRQAVGSLQMPFEHLQFSAIFQADDVIREDGLLDRYCWFFVWRRHLRDNASSPWAERPRSVAYTSLTLFSFSGVQHYTSALGLWGTGLRLGISIAACDHLLHLRILCLWGSLIGLTGLGAFCAPWIGAFNGIAAAVLLEL